MGPQNTPTPEHFGSAQDLMNEALENASVELDKMVKASIESLTAFNTTLEKTLRIQLQKLVEQSQNIIDSHVDDLVTHREELLERLADFERTETITLTSAAREVRQQVIQRAEEAADAVVKLVEQQIVQLRAAADVSESRFNPFSETNATTIKNLTTQGQGRIENEEQGKEKVLTDKVQALDKDVSDVIASAKASIERTLSQHNVEMEQKIESVLTQLSEVVTSTIGDIETTSANGLKSLEAANNAGKDRLVTTLEEWKTDCNEINDSLRENLTAESRTSEKMHSTRLDHKVGEVKDEINQISQNAVTKLVASHKLFSSSLKRLEKRYHDRLERLISKFETALAEEAKLPQASSQNAQELKELMHARLQARAKEIAKALQRQVDQIEAEYTRYSGSTNERIESIKTAAVESLDKQNKILKGELDRVIRGFTTEVTELKLELPQVEEAGRAAALAVMAYRDARLSFGTD
ncbi:MAG TPA: hypothetical protein V6C97_22600 [Oculatellaceae cyanobacterium]